MLKKGEVFQYSAKIGSMKAIWIELETSRNLTKKEVRGYLESLLKLGLPNFVSQSAREIIINKDKRN